LAGRPRGKGFGAKKSDEWQSSKVWIHAEEKDTGMKLDWRYGGVLLGGTGFEGASGGNKNTGKFQSGWRQEKGNYPCHISNHVPKHVMIERQKGVWLTVGETGKKNG